MKNKKQVIENLARCIYGVSSMRVRVDDINGNGVAALQVIEALNECIKLVNEEEEAVTPEKQDGGGDT